MTLEQARTIFTEGWNIRFQKPNPYNNKKQKVECGVFDSGECAGSQVLDNLEDSFNYWRENNGFPLTNKERAATYLSQIPE